MVYAIFNGGNNKKKLVINSKISIASQIQTN